MQALGFHWTMIARLIVAATILHRRGDVRGLTTAATLWVTAAIGLSVGVGMYVMSLETTVLVFPLLRFGPRPGGQTTADKPAAQERAA